MWAMPVVYTVAALTIGYAIGRMSKVAEATYMTEDEMFRRLTLIYAEKKQRNLSALVLKEDIEIASSKAVQDANPEREYYRPANA